MAHKDPRVGAAYKRAWERANRERLNAKSRARYAAHIEEEHLRQRNRPESYRIKQRAASRARYQLKREEMLQWQARYRAENLEKVRERRRAWQKRNRSSATAAWAKWYTAKLQACPKWVDLKAIQEIYDTAAWITETTGVKHDVDHIVPLQGENVCGLHVPWNLQILNRSTNARKSNHV